MDIPEKAWEDIARMVKSYNEREELDTLDEVVCRFFALMRVLTPLVRQWEIERSH
jgi:hypothetical protein